MKPAGIVGIILIAIGIIALAYGWFGGSFSYTTRENVAKLGPLKVRAADGGQTVVTGELGVHERRSAFIKRQMRS